MKYHVVQVNEKIQDVSRKYNVAVDEIIKLNRHINNIDSIVPGMKLRLPILSDEVSDQLKDSFLDIKKYYPKIEDFKEAKIEKKENKVMDQEKIEQKPLPQQPSYSNYQYYPYQTYNPYMQPVYPTYQQPYQYQIPQTNYNYQPRLTPINANVSNGDYSTINKQDESVFKNPNTYNNNNSLEIKCDQSIYQGYRNFFQSPRFTPPYPCGKQIDEIDKVNFDFQDKNNHKININEFDEDVKEIKADLRGFIKKHTKIRKKDPLDIL